MTKRAFPRRFPFEMLERQLHYRQRHLADLSLHGVVRLEGRVDEAVAARAVRLCADVFPILGCVVEEGRWGLSWVRLDDLDRRAWCDVVACEDEAAALDAYMRVPCDPWAGTPPMHLRILRGPKGDTLVFKTHHAAADALSGKATFYALAETYRKLVDRPDFQPDPRAYVRRIDPRALSPRQVLAVARQAVREEAPPDLTGLVGLPLVDGGARDTRFVDHRISRASLRALRRYARDRNAGFHDAMNALLAYAVLARFGDGRPARVPMLNPVDLRRYDPRAQDGEGPRNLAAFAEFVVAPRALDLDELLAACRDALRRLLDSQCAGLSPLPKLWLRDLLPNRVITDAVDKKWAKALAYKAKGVNVPMPLSISNAGLIDARRLAFPGATVVDASMIGFGHFHMPYFSFTVFEGEVSLIVRYAEKDGMGEHVRALLAIVDEQIARISEREGRAKAA